MGRIRSLGRLFGAVAPAAAPPPVRKRTRMSFRRQVPSRTIRRDRRADLEFPRLLPAITQEFLGGEDMFVDRFGIDHIEFEELHGLLEEKIRRYHTRFQVNIGTRERLAICLRFLATGDSMNVLSRHYGIPNNVVPTVLRETCKTIADNLMPRVMKQPTKKMWLKNAAEFKRKFDMPNCIGALEGKNLYVNKQKIVLLALADARDRFIMVDVGLYRLNFYRGNVMDDSRLGKLLANNQLDVPENAPLVENGEPMPYVILASSFFPSKPYLMTKYSKPECAANEANRVFNTRLSRAKVTVNRALLRLRKRWRIFQGPLTVAPPFVELIVQSCCCLHNLFGLRKYEPLVPSRADPVIAITNDRLSALQNLLPKQPVDVKNKFKQHFFTSDGEISWQWQDVVN